MAAEIVKPTERWIRIRDVADALGGQSRRTIIRLIESGDLHGIKLRPGGASRWLVSESSFARFIAERTERLHGGEKL